MRKLRMLSLCAGIGGADLAAEWTGAIEVVGQVEIDVFCQAVLAKHWPTVKRMDDIKEVVGDEFGAIDLVVGGVPCTPFSSAGEQRGKEDDRYLWPEMFRIVEKSRPVWVILENVDDLTYMVLDDVQADLESAEYAVQAFVLPACAIGAPHERQRCFVAAYHSGFGGRTRRAKSKDKLRASDIDCLGSSNVADAKHGRCEWGSFNEDQPDTAMLRGGSTAWPEPQPRMGRVLDGISARLDRHRWPALRGQAQQDWESARTIEGRSTHRRNRLKALGNAIVPQQIYPILQCIVACEGGDE